MKKIVVILVCIIFAFTLLPLTASTAANGNEVSDYGAYLKSVGVVQGYPDGSLKENKYITQAEYLVLLAKMLKKTKVVKRGNLVKQVNFFDRLVNKAYHAYLILKNKFADFYYNKIIYYIPYYRRKLKADKYGWFVPYAIYLKRNGFSIPQDFKPDSVISAENAVRWLLSVLSLDENAEKIVSAPGIDDSYIIYALSCEHGIPIGNTPLAKPVKRGEAFKFVYSVLAK
jgi:hypothetical protein